jgi:hypothetical protein
MQRLNSLFLFFVPAAKVAGIFEKANKAFI